MKTVTLDRKGVKVFYLPFLMIFLISFIFTISGISTLVNAQQQSPPIVNILSPNSERICNGKICFLNIHEPTRVWNPTTSSWVDGKANDFITSSVNTTNFGITFTYFNQSFIIYPKYFVYNNINMNAQTFLSTLKGRFQNSNITIGVSNNNMGKKMVYSINSNSQALSLLSEVDFGIVNNSKDLLFLTDDLSTNGFNFTYNGTDLIIYSPFPSFSFDPLLLIQGVNTMVDGFTDNTYTELAAPTSNVTGTKFTATQNTSASSYGGDAVSVTGTSKLDEGVFTNITLPIGASDTINWVKVLHRNNATTDTPYFALWNWTSGAFVNVNASGVAGRPQQNNTFNITGVNRTFFISPNDKILAVSYGLGGSQGTIYMDYVEVFVSYNDLTPPTWSNNQTNNTNANRSTLFSLKWNDNNGGGLAGYIFSFDNCTGSFVNSTWTAMTGTENWSNVTKTINSTNGCPIRWRVYANDTANNWNVSDIFTFTTTQFITVCKSGSCDSTTVQGGINLAPAGWSVLITDSSWYNENVTLNKSITLTSNSATRPTINSTGTSLLINANGAAVSNLTIAYNGTATYQDTVWITGNYTTVTNNTIRMASVNNNYPLYIKNSANNTVYNNNITSDSWGSQAIYITGSSSTNNTIDSNNIAYDPTGWSDVLIDANNNTIKNNNITSAGGSLPIYMYSYFDNLVIQNNNYNDKPIVYNTSLQSLTITATTYGSLILANSFNVTVNKSSFTEAGILFLKTTNSTISNSNVTTKTDAIVIEAASNYDTIFNNNISTSGSESSYGITIDTGGGTYTNITKNNITTAGDYDNHAIWDLDDYGTISSNIITTSASTASGIYLLSDYNNIINTNITTSGSRARGILFYGADNNNVTSCNITTTGAACTATVDTRSNNDYICSAIHIRKGDNNRISNSILNTTNYYDIFASGNSNQVNYIVNSIYNKTDIKFNESSTVKLYNQYYLDVYVNDTFGNPLNSANVLITSNSLPYINIGLVGYWKFENESLGVAMDYSEYRNNGTLTNMNNTGNTSSGPTTGMFGKGMQFDGVNAYVNVPNSPAFDTAINSSGKMTIAMWLKPIYPGDAWGTVYSRNSWPAERLRFLTHNQTGYEYHDIVFNTTCGRKTVWLAGDGSNPQYYLNNNSWNFWVWAYNGSVSQFYLSGDLIYSETIGNCPIALDDHSALIIGTHGGQTFTGTIDEFQIWSRSLSGDEVKQLYQTRNGYGVETNSSGYIDQQILSEFMGNWTYNATTGYLYFTNYTVNASKSGYTNDSQQVNLTSNQLITLTLRDLIPPTWSSNSTSIVSTYSPTSVSSFNITWSDNTAVSKAFLESNFSGSPTNYSMTQIATNVYNFNASISAGTSYWKSYANDTSNNWNVSDTWYFSINKTQPVLILSNNTAAVNTSGLVGYWRFENESLGYATDYSGWNNTGTLTNMNNAGNSTSGPTNDGRFGKGMQFDKVNDFINISDSNNWYFGSGSFAIDFWVKFNKLPTNGSWAMIYDQGTPDYVHENFFGLYNNSGTYQWKFFSEWSGYVFALNTTLSTGTWYHIAVTYSSASTSWYLFQNGIEIGSPIVNNDGMSNVPAPLLIGAYVGPTLFLNGTLDEFRIWKGHGLTADEVKELYESNVPYGTQTNFTFTEQNTGDSDVNYDFFRNGTVAGVWHFDEGSGNTTVDDSGNGNHGTLTNMNNTGNNLNGTVPSGWTTGRYGNGLGFDGGDDIVTIPDSASLDSSSLTIETWVKLAFDYTTAGHGILNKIDYNAGGYLLYIGSSGVIALDYNNGTTTLWPNSNSLTWQQNIWYHVVVSHNAATGVTNFYRDGSFVGSTTGGWPIAPTNKNLRIGMGDTSRWNGTIDEVRIYPRALSAAEILCHYGNNCTAAGIYSDAQTLGAGYHYYVARASGGQNYTTSALLLPLNITKANANVQLSPASQNITYGTSVTAYCTSSGAVCKLYRNDSDVTAQNNTPITLGVGVYVYKANISDSQNYTNWESGTSTIGVSKANLILILSNNTASVNTSGLVGYWRFENESLGYATDYSGWNNTGTLTNMNNSGNATSGPTGGRFGKTMQFDGVDDYITVADSNNWYFGTNDFAIDFWVMFNTLPVSGGYERIYTQYVDSNNRISFSLYNNSGTYQWLMTALGGGTSYYSGFNDAGLATNTWYHIAYVRNGNNHMVFRNGVQVSYTDVDSQAFPDLASSLYIGQSGGNGNYLNGSLDEIHIWNRSLTADEIKELYESNVAYGTQTNFTLSEQNTGDADVYYDFFRNGTVAGVWHFDEGSGSTAVDSSGNGNSGTLKNATNGTVTWTTGKFANALNFSTNGTRGGGYVSLPSSASLNVTQPVTITAWIYTYSSSAATGNVNTIISRQTANGDERIGISKTNDAFFVEWGNYTDPSYLQTSGGSINPNQWYFVAFTYDASGTANLYINGSLLTGSTVHDNVTNYADVLSAPLYIGYYWSGSPSFNGTIDELRIYPRALSAAEILCQYGNNCTQAGIYNDAQTLGAGYHYYSAYASGGQNYTTSALLLPLNITKANANVQLSPASQNITYGTSVLQYCSSSGIVCKLYKNDTDVTASNNTATTLGAGGYSYVANVSDTQNYTNAQASSIVTINKANPILILNNNTASVNSSGLVGYWRFENESLGYATDYSGWNNTGTLKNMNNTGNATSGPTNGGRIGKGMRFDAENAYVSAGNPSSLNIKNTMSVFAWVKRNGNSYTPYERVAGKFYYNGTDNTGSWLIYKSGNGNASACAFNISGSFVYATSPNNTFLTDTWYWVGCVYDGTSVINYINGTRQKVTATTGSIGDSNYPVTIGTTSNGTDIQNNFNGTIDEVQIWNRSLTTDEINELYQSSVPYGTQTNFTFSEQNTGDADVYYDFFRNGTVAGMWHFDEGSGTTTVDSSGISSSATIPSNVTWTANGKYGSALYFNGSTSGNYVNTNNNGNYSSLTVIAWVKINDTLNNYQTAVAKYDFGNGGQRAWILQLNPDVGIGRIPYFAIYPTPSNGGDYFQAYSGVDIYPNTWAQIAGTYNGTVLSIYVNGALATTTTNSSGIPSTTAFITIGATSNSAQPFNGTIDEVRIYPRALSSVEILCHYGNNCTQTVFSNETATLPAGYHYYVATASGGQNYTSSALLLPLNIVESTQVGGALSWIWKSPVIGDIVRSGSPLDWVWQVFTSGSGRKIPKGSATNWTWGNE